MTAKNSELRYGSVAMTLHWLIALLIFGNIASGFVIANVLDDNDPLQATLLQLHKPAGLTILTLTAILLGWRMINPIPPLPVGMTLPMRLLARGTHYLLYFLMLAIPLAGWALVSVSRSGGSTSYFGLFQWPTIPLFANLSHLDRSADHALFGTLHQWMAYGAFTLIGLHIAAALYHHFLRRDDVLKRMLPGTTVRNPPA